MATDQPLQTNLEICPSVSAKMRISLVSWIVSIETDIIGIPFLNLLLVLHQPTEAPLEPLKETSLKHLTSKMAFLLALGSGKCRSEVHAWLSKNIRHQSDWSKVSIPLSQLPFKELAGKRGSKQCGPSGYSSHGPNCG